MYTKICLKSLFLSISSTTMIPFKPYDKDIYLFENAHFFQDYLGHADLWELLVSVGNLERLVHQADQVSQVNVEKMVNRALLEKQVPPDPLDQEDLLVHQVKEAKGGQRVQPELREQQDHKVFVGRWDLLVNLVLADPKVLTDNVDLLAQVDHLVNQENLALLVYQDPLDNQGQQVHRVNEVNQDLLDSLVFQVKEVSVGHVASQVHRVILAHQDLQV